MYPLIERRHYAHYFRQKLWLSFDVVAYYYHICTRG